MSDRTYTEEISAAAEDIVHAADALDIAAHAMARAAAGAPGLDISPDRDGRDLSTLSGLADEAKSLARASCQMETWAKALRAGKGGAHG